MQKTTLPLIAAAISLVLTACAAPAPISPAAPPAAAPTATVEPTTQPVAATETTVPEAAPAVAEGEVKTVSIENVTFDAAPALAGAWTGALFQENSDPNAPPDMDSGPRRVVISATTSFELAKDAPIVPQLFVYAVADLAGKPEQSQADALSKLLAGGGSAALTGAMTETLPYLPIVNASQAIHAAVKDVAFKNGKGIRYLSAFKQDPSPFLAQNFVYTFQGLTEDGKHYIAFTSPLSTTLFPAELPKDFDEAAHMANLDAYLAKSAATLDGAGADAFAPPLALLDSFVQSISIGAEAGAGAADFSGVYTASLPGPDAGRPVTLTLSADGTASMLTDQRNGEPVEEQTGTWVANDAVSMIVTLTGTASAPVTDVNVITFTLNGASLTAVDFNHPENYGTAGLQLQKVTADTSDAGGATSAPPAELTAGTWQLTKIAPATGAATVVPDPSKYTLAFGDDWRVTIQADCNQGGGPFDAGDGKLKLGMLITTMASCGEGSLADAFMKDLQSATGYSVQGEALTIMLGSNDGTLEFQRVK